MGRRTRRGYYNSPPQNGPSKRDKETKKSDNVPTEEVKEDQKHVQSVVTVPVSESVFINPATRKRDPQREKTSMDESVPERPTFPVCNSCNQPMLALNHMSLERSVNTKKAIADLVAEIEELSSGESPTTDWKDVSNRSSDVLKSCAEDIAALNKIMESLKKDKLNDDNEKDHANFDKRDFEIFHNFMPEADTECLMTSTNELEFHVEGTREVFYAGKFPYKYANKVHQEREIPDFLQDIIKKLPLPDGHIINSVLVNKYADGSASLGAHADDEPSICPWSSIYNLSAGETRDMTFSCRGKVIQTHELKSGTLNVMSRALQNRYKHEIAANGDAKRVRYSYTFRHIDPCFETSSTLILSDSQCHEVKFGGTMGTLGPKCPGTRVNTFLVDHLIDEDPAFIASFKTVILALGINNLQNKSSRYSEAWDIARVIERKCEEVLKLNPHIKIGISTVIPTKDPELNKKVYEFNRILGIITLRLNKDSDRVTFLNFDYMGFYKDGTLRNAFRNNSDSDPIHINSIGAKVVGGHFKQFIRQVGFYKKKYINIRHVDV